MTLSYYPLRSTLKRVIYAYNEYDIVSLTKMLSGEQINILGVKIPENENLPDTIYTQLLYNTLQRYMYAEIGFDTDEHFIDRFNGVWNSYSKAYYQRLKIIDEQSNNLFSRIISRNGSNNTTENNTITDNGENNKTDTGNNSNEISDNINGNTSGTGNRTEYEVNTQNSTATNTSESNQQRTEKSTINETHNTTNNNTRKEEKNHNITTSQDVTETEVNMEKFSVLEKVTNILDDFADKFNSLFMQVFTNM